MKKTIKLVKTIGDFAENKDAARILRAEQIIPSLKKGDDVILDFKNVNGATQSFIHALISEPIRVFGNIAFGVGNGSSYPNDGRGRCKR